MTYVLGLNAYRADAAACLVSDGDLVAAVAEERFRRVRHWSGFPGESIRYCLREAGIALADVAHVAIAGDGIAGRWRKLAHAVTAGASLRYAIPRLSLPDGRARLVDDLARTLPEETFAGTVHAVDPELCHLASAFLVSPFRKAVAVSIDGVGDFSSAAWGLGDGSRLAVDGRVRFPHSLGMFYAALTQFIGFADLGDEHRTMELAASGKPVFVDRIKQLLDLRHDGTFSLNLRYFRHAAGKGTIDRAWTDALVELLGPARDPSAPIEERHCDIARSVQVTYENAFFNLLTALHGRYGTDAVSIAGNCAANAVANGQISERTPFRHVHVQPAAGDADASIGAAFATWHKVEGERAKRHFVMDHAYWGPSATPEEIAVATAARRADFQAAGCRIMRIADEATLCRRAAAAIAEGKVVGWFQGRLEWGSQALGNRSILADPRRVDMRRILDLTVGLRDPVRPFAASILREAVKDWFETDGDVPFMTQVFRIRTERRDRIPAVSHADGLGRLQTVTWSGNSRYARLIQIFDEITGVPIVLNASFDEDEPIMCKPAEAIDRFLRTAVDVLVLGDSYIER